MTKSPKPRDGAAAETSDESSKCKNNNIKKARRTRKGLPREAPQRRSSIYRGVTRHRWTGRYEAHLWDKHSWNDSQNKKGRQVYLGAYDDEAAAARAYDLAALKYWAHDANLNFPLSTYEEEVKEMDGQSKEEYIGSLRRKSNGFSRGVSKYRGVARHHHNGRWEARIGRVLGNKYLYLGTYATQEEAAMAYDVAAVKYRGLNAVTNFDLSRYTDSLDAPQDNLTTHDAEGNRDDCNNTGTQDSCQDIWLTYANGESKSPIITSGIAPWQDLRVDEMMEQTIASDKSLSSTSEVEPEIGHHVRRSFPDDIQTSFGFEDSSNFADDHGIIFGNYDSFASSVLEYEMDSFELDLNLNH